MIRTSYHGADTGRTLFTTSWDDGDPCDVVAADMLSRFGLRGTFYASTGPSGTRLINDDALHWIAERHELGNHGRTHTPFIDLSRAALIEELAWGCADLSRFGPAPTMVAPPKGRISREVLGVLGSLG